jgi:hypothetical protein
MTLPAPGPRIRQRPPGKTLVDWLALGIGPVLIMCLTGSLVFFLAQVGYRGSFSGEVRWTLFWFTVASVLVSRISIEQGAAHGSLYGLALGVATAIRMIGFLGAPLSALLLLGVIWWCASKLTWDCTVIDDDEDASGQGLLQRAGFEAAGAEAGAARRAHAPGLWVIYVALGALPVFGVGQWMIPVTDVEGRLRGFTLVFVFVASALALLLTSSFLGIRRYLRQRNLAMPLPMARSWIGVGAAMLGAVLFVALLLPRPRGLETLAGLGLGLRDRPQEASSTAWMKGEAAEGPGPEMGTQEQDLAGGTRPGRGIPGGQKPAAGVDAGPGATGDAARGETAAFEEGGRGTGGSSGTGGLRETTSGREGARRQGGGAFEPAPSGQAQGGGEPPPMRPASAPPVSPLSIDFLAILRGLSWLIGLGLAAYLLVRFGRGWLEALRKSIPARRPRAPKPGGEPARGLRFPGFANPFGTGRAEGMSSGQLAVYTFAALEAWAADAGRERREEETPMEFGEGLVRTHPGWHEELRGAVRVYASVIYGGRTPSAESVELLRRLWGRWG